MATTAQTIDIKLILEKVVPAVQMVMSGAMKADGLQFSSGMREAGAAAKYIANSKSTYKGNPIIEGMIDSLSHRKGEFKEKVDLRILDDAAVMERVDEVVPTLDAAGEQGAHTKAFTYSLGEAVVGASGSGPMGSGERITPEEAKFLDELKEHLHI
jgi:hypothetical protein